jgi:hypothetical protein
MNAVSPCIRGLCVWVLGASPSHRKTLQYRQSMQLGPLASSTIRSRQWLT